MRSHISDAKKAELWEKETGDFKGHPAFRDKYINTDKDPKIALSDLRKRYNLWIREGLPLSNSPLIAEYLNAETPSAYVLALKKEANDLIRDGFDPNDPAQVFKAFVGIRVQGIYIEFREFEERVACLRKYNEKHPGYFKGLFTKAKGMRPIVISTTEAHEMDTSGLSAAVFDEHLEKLRGIKREIDGFSWFEKNLPKHKHFNPRNFYHRWKRDQAIEEGALKPEERFKVLFPETEEIREELLENKRMFYRFVFEMAMEKMADRKNRDKYLELMGALIVSDILEDGALLTRLSSSDMEQRVVYFKILYEDYIRHLPNAAGYRPDEIKGLMEVIGELSRPVHEELAKATKVFSNTAGQYTLKPAGFLGVFRGRAGIIDSTFNMTDGALFTQAMHEDILIYLVRKGKDLKGYVGLMWGLDEAGRKVLTVDVIQSASLDGGELLTNLLTALDRFSIKNGGIGIALPEKMDVSFNFDNKNTLCDMSVYQEAIPVDVTMIHKESWDNLTGMFGRDPWGKNTIEIGKFELLVMQDSRVATQMSYRKGRALAEDSASLSGIGPDEAKRLLRTMESCPAFKWGYKKLGAHYEHILTSDKYGSGLKGFVRSFRKLGGLKNWSLAFHGSNQAGAGDIFTYVDAAVKNIPEISDIREELRKIAVAVPPNVRLTERIRRDLMILGLVDGALLRLEEKASGKDCSASAKVALFDMAG